jgi:hypothetical protein
VRKKDEKKENKEEIEKCKGGTKKRKRRNK